MARLEAAFPNGLMEGWDEGSSQHVHDAIPAKGPRNKACIVAVELHNERAHFISAEDV
jgi:hypothetical protein